MNLACGTPSKPLRPKRGSCPYWAQYQSFGTWVAAAELPFNPRYLEDGEVVVIDDADLSRSLVARFYLALDAIDRALEHLKGKRWLEVRQILTVVAHALVDAPRYENGQGGSILLGPAVWDHLVSTACRYGADLPALIGALPEALKLPNPKAKGDGGLTVEDVKAAPRVAPLRLLGSHTTRE